MLSASYAAGVLAASLPSGLAAARYGPRARRAGRGLADRGRERRLRVRRRAPGCWARHACLQGVGSALSWAGALAWLVAAAPRERRGELIGTTMGAAVFGALLGPVIGAIATVAGREVRPSSASACSASALAAWVALTPGVPAQPQPMHELFRRADRRLLGGMWLLVLPALLFGVLAVLVPLRLHARRLGRRRDRRRLPRHCRVRDGAQPAARPLHRPARLHAAGTCRARRLGCGLARFRGGDLGADRGARSSSSPASRTAASTRPG